MIHHLKHYCDRLSAPRVGDAAEKIASVCHEALLLRSGILHLNGKFVNITKSQILLTEVPGRFIVDGILLIITDNYIDKIILPGPCRVYDILQADAAIGNVMTVM